MNAQNKIIGKYVANTQSFETKDKNYWIGFFENGIAQISKDGYFGLIDSLGTILCKPKYDKIYAFEGNVAKVGLNGKFGLIDKKGNELAKPFTPLLSRFWKGVAIYNELGFWRYGLINQDGSLLTKANYKILSYRKEGYFVFSKQDTIGIIDLEGKETIIEGISEKDKPIGVSHGVMYLTNYDQYGNKLRKGAGSYHTPILDYLTIGYSPIRLQPSLLQKKGKPLEFLEFNEGLTITFKKVDKIYKFGFIDKQFKIVISPKYDYASRFKGGYALVSLNGKWGVINKKGKVVIPFKYSKYIHLLPNEKFIVFESNYFKVVNTSLEVLLQSSYPMFYLFDGLLASYKNEKWGIIDLNNNEVLPYEFDGFLQKNDHVGIAYQKKGYYASNLSRMPPFEKITYSYFDSKGQLKPHKVYDGFGDIDFGILCLDYENDPAANIEKVNNKYQVIEEVKRGHKIIGEFKKSYIMSSVFVVNPYPVIYNKRIVNHKKEVVIPATYDEIFNNRTNLFVVRKQGKYGVVNLKNEEIIPLQYEQVVIFSGVIVAYKKSKTGKIMGGVFDLTGTLLIPFKEKTYMGVPAGNLIVQDSSNSYMIDKKGNKIK